MPCRHITDVKVEVIRATYSTLCEAIIKPSNFTMTITNDYFESVSSSKPASTSDVRAEVRAEFAKYSFTSTTDISQKPLKVEKWRKYLVFTSKRLISHKNGPKWKCDTSTYIYFENN